MPIEHCSAKDGKRQKINRSHSGCKPCRRRGKRCDETKPFCRACTRLSLECSYVADFSFRNVTGTLVQRRDNCRAVSISPVAKYFRPNTLSSGQDTRFDEHIFKSLKEFSIPKLPAILHSEDNLEASYFNHFQRHVRHLLPEAFLRFALESTQPHYLRFSVLCIAASNLSMLDAQVQSRILSGDSRRSVFSPSVNNLHHFNAQKYHDLALWYCRTASDDELKRQAPALLAMRILLAYYHHASTDHLRFRLAVWDCVRFVLLNKTSIINSPDGPDSLQMWYRLCTSHRPAKPPALLLEGEGVSSFGPNLLSENSDYLYLNCILGMSADDLIYDIIIKTTEIRTKLVVFQCVAGSCQISELSSEINSVAHEMLNKLLGRSCGADEYAEAREGFVRGSHLLGLLDVQKERLKVWKSRLTADQLPSDLLNLCEQSQTSWHVSSTMSHKFPTHRDAMNALYCILCEIAFEEANTAPVSDMATPGVNNERSISRVENLAHRMCQIAGTLDLTLSNTWDVYTLSLTETFLQLVLLWRSDEIFHYILDVLWPQFEMKGKGYEHSHYPTHLVKRSIAQIAEYWEQGRIVKFAQLAVPETISKLELLDINHPVDIVVCGYNKGGGYYVEKISLP